MSEAARLGAIGAALSAATGARFAAAPAGGVGGGCINEAFRWPAGTDSAFVKLAPAARLAMFEAEAEGLRALETAAAVRVPRVLACGEAAGRSFLALEWIEPGATSARSEARLGERLAAQHRTSEARFGWHRDNTIGLTHQPNARSGDWAEFFRERRLRHQLELAAAKGFAALLATRGARLIEAVDRLLAGHRPPPSLLHGDLWGGNWFTAADGEPVVFDPAVYFGDREADLAMTRLFGGFGPAFHAAYAEAWPLPEGHAVRAELYNLYHVLNHANLFGESYARQAAAMIDRLLERARG